MSELPSFFRTIRAVAKGYVPRVSQARGWVLAGLAVIPVILALTLETLVHHSDGISATAGLKIFHDFMVKLMLPVMALVAAPAGIREDLEQRTLPLFLVRPAQVWALPFGKGVIWYGWGGLWMVIASLGLLPLGAEWESVPFLALALLTAYWAELAFMSLVGLHFKRGSLWGALYLFIWDPLVRILPGNLQRLTFLHYIESIAGSRGGDVSKVQFLAQEQISTPWWIAALALILFGFLCWGLCGWKLQTTPIGLAGSEAEG